MPYIDKNSSKSYGKRFPLTAKEKDELVLYWVHKVIPVERMFDLFFSNVTFQEANSCEDPTINRYELKIETAKRILEIIKNAFPSVYNESVQYRDLWIRKGQDIR